MFGETWPRPWFTGWRAEQCAGAGRAGGRPILQVRRAQTLHPPAACRETTSHYCESCVSTTIKMMRRTTSGRPALPVKRKPVLLRNPVNGLSQKVVAPVLPKLRRRKAKQRGKRPLAQNLQPMAPTSEEEEPVFPGNLAPVKQVKRGEQ